MELSPIQKIANVSGIPLLSGTNFFVTIAALGGIQLWANRTIPGMEVLSNKWIIGISASVYILETLISFIYNIFTPAIPIDTVKETFKSLIIVPASAVLTAMIGNAESSQQPISAVFAGPNVDAASAIYFLLGGVMASMSQSLKIFIRSLIDMLPEPFTNLATEIVEGGISLVGMLTLVYAPWLMIIIIVLFTAIFILIGPRIFRSVKTTYKAFFSLLKYWIGGRQRNVFDIDYLDTKTKQKLSQKVPKEKVEAIVRVIVDKAKGIKPNKQGYLLITNKEFQIVCLGLFRVSAKSIARETIKENIMKYGILCNYMEFKAPREVIRLKFIKTWAADCELLAQISGAEIISPFAFTGRILDTIKSSTNRPKQDPV